ncbi:MAG: hypothetical protein AB1466_02290 [Actinomycetota bacterium]
MYKKWLGAAIGALFLLSMPFYARFEVKWLRVGGNHLKMARNYLKIGDNYIRMSRKYMHMKDINRSEILRCVGSACYNLDNSYSHLKMAHLYFEGSNLYPSNFLSDSEIYLERSRDYQKEAMDCFFARDQSEIFDNLIASRAFLYESYNSLKRGHDILTLIGFIALGISILIAGCLVIFGRSRVSSLTGFFR